MIGTKPAVHFRLLRSLYAGIRQDLARQHAHAGERVGFVTAKLGNAGGNPKLVIASEYFPVADERYIRDPHIGARIDGKAILMAMQLGRSGNCGVFHTHLHPHNGHPRLSRPDVRELPELVQSLRNVAPDQAHGLLLLSYDRCTAFVLMPGEDLLREVSQMTVVGYPTELIG
jgi:hypothetical protein